MINSHKILDVRFHGRGGQGVVTGSRLLAEAALLEDKFVHAFPAFGPERAGAPITGFTRLSDEKFSIKTEIYEPNIVIVQDNTLLGQVNILAGIQPNGFVIINHTQPKAIFQHLGPISDPSLTFAVINASKIAMTRLGFNIANTALVGAMVKITGIVQIDNVVTAVKTLFSGSKGEKNALAIMDAYQSVEIITPPSEITVERSQDEPTPSSLSSDMQTMHSWVQEKWGYEKLPIGTVVPIPGSSLAFKTGDWAEHHPTLDKSKCTSCRICFFVCPDTAITWTRDNELPKGYPVINTDYCKGCLICLHECPEHAFFVSRIV